MQVNMTVNGQDVSADVEPRTLLVHFLRDTLEEMLGAAVEVIDTAEPVARRVLQQLAEHGIAFTSDGAVAEIVCSATGDALAFEETLERLRAAGAALPPLCVIDTPAIIAASAVNEQPA